MEFIIYHLSLLFGFLQRIIFKLISATSSVILPLGIIYLTLPILFYFFPSTMQRIFFLNFVKVPGVDYDDLQMHGVHSAGRNFYLHLLDGTISSTKDPSKDAIGVWHILPKTSSNEAMSHDEIEGLLERDNDAIVLYFHGNSFDRSQYHRVQIYNMLSNLGFHVLAIDYEGYGDSSGHPSEEALVRNAHAIHDYAKKLAPSKDIFVWGHSMGTGISTRIVAELSDAGKHPKGLILEAPFNNLPDVIKHHWMSAAFRFLPWFDMIVVEPLISAGLIMSSDERIKRVKCPIMVFHAEDDHIIPIGLARKLVASAREANRDIEFWEFEAGKNYFHKFLHTAHNLKELVQGFTEKCQIPDRSKNRVK